MKVVLLSGGGGGAKLARGLAGVLQPDELTVVVNVGDDLEVLGLSVSPDLDSLLYTLSGRLDDERGWGRAGESWRALSAVTEWGGDDWFRLGDLDLGLHLVRTEALRAGAVLSAVTEQLAQRIELPARLLPATDDPVRTYVSTPAGSFPFQEWYVARGHEDEVVAVEYAGAGDATPAPGVVEALAAADAVVIAPSNPFLSIEPILAVAGIREALVRRHVRSLAVSPLVAGRSVTGPLDRMLSRMAGGTTPAHVTDRYKGLLDVLVVDRADLPAQADVPLAGTDTVMRDREAERRLAQFVLEAACV